ncbi:MAG TPA: hypothetical protein VI670_08490 [Thermoanaerobaculia bacterium]|jgi:hypothetical protein
MALSITCSPSWFCGEEEDHNRAIASGRAVQSRLIRFARRSTAAAATTAFASAARRRSRLRRRAVLASISALAAIPQRRATTAARTAAKIAADPRDGAGISAIGEYRRLPLLPVGVGSASVSAVSGRNFAGALGASATGGSAAVERTSAATAAATARESHVAERRWGTVESSAAGLVIASASATRASAASLADYDAQRDAWRHADSLRNHGRARAAAAARPVVGTVVRLIARAARAAAAAPPPTPITSTAVTPRGGNHWQSTGVLASKRSKPRETRSRSCCTVFCPQLEVAGLVRRSCASADPRYSTQKNKT